MVLVMHGGLGDEICSIPLIRELSKREEIYINYSYPEVILASNCVASTTKEEGTKIKWHDEVGADYSTNKDYYRLHLVDFFASQLGITLEDRSINIEVPSKHIDTAESILKGLPHPIVLYNNYTGWPAKGSMNNNTISSIYKYITGIGGSLVQVGTKPQWTGIGYNLVGYTNSLLEMAALLSTCDLYIGNDSGLAHLTEAVGGRSLILYASTAPECYVHSSKQHTVCNKECYGCFNLKSNQDIVKNHCLYKDRGHCINYDYKVTSILSELDIILGKE